MQNNNLIFYGGGLVLLYFMLSPLLEFLGVKKSDEELDVIDTINTNGNAWDADFYKTAPSGSTLITRASAENLSKQIYDSFHRGFVGEDYTKIFSVFKELKTKTSVSFLADVFDLKYGRSLLLTLKQGVSPFMSLPWEGLDADELAAIIGYVDRLPAYHV